jgi:hypothetical protein
MSRVIVVGALEKVGKKIPLIIGALKGGNASCWKRVDGSENSEI